MGLYAWGLVDDVDYLMTLPQIDKNKIIALDIRDWVKLLFGLLRKMNDLLCLFQIIQAVVEQLCLRKVGEHIAGVNQNFPHWFNSKFEITMKEEKLPLSQRVYF